MQEQEVRYEERTVPVCPVCHNLVRRDLGPSTPTGHQHGPWRCDLHGEVGVIWETYEVPV